MNSAKWLTWGLGIKRWLLVLFAGILLLGLGFVYLLVQVYQIVVFPPFVYYLTLQFLDRTVRSVLFILLGLLLFGVALVKLNRALLAVLPGSQPSIVEVLYRKRNREQGIKVVAIGGGTGLSTLLRGLKHYTENITAIVTVADDGGSSGRLRQELGLLPPGDFRQCIAALAESEPLMTMLFEYRFGQGELLEGHAFGNLFIAAMAGVTGNFERALLESSRVLAVRGRIIPSTLENVTLCAEFQGGDSSSFQRVQGESRLSKFGSPISRVFIEPENARAYPGAVRAILEADLIVAGPGSLYTSVLPNLLVPDIANALRAAAAQKVYVCNVATERGETDGLGALEHASALEEHLGARIFETVMVNNNVSRPLPPLAQIEYVLPPPSDRFDFVSADVADEQSPWRHDPAKLAAEVLHWYGQAVKGTARKPSTLRGQNEQRQSIPA